MRNRKTEICIASLLGVLLVSLSIAVIAGTVVAAQKIREHSATSDRSSASSSKGGSEATSETEASGRSTGDQENPGDVRIQITTGKGDTAHNVVIHSQAPWRDRDSRDIVRMGENITIESDQVVDGDVVSVGGNVLVLGHVRGDVVSVGGNVDLQGNGIIDGDGVSVGGRVRKEPGTRLGGQNVGMRFIPSGLLGHWPSTSHDHGHPLISTAFWILILVFFGLIGWLLTALFEKQMRLVGTHVQEHLWASLLTGLAVVVLFPAAFVLLLVTIVGIPVALLSPLALGLAHMMGLIIVSTLVGLRLIKNPGLTRSGWLLGMAAGLLFFVGFPIVGHVIKALGSPFRFLGIVIVVVGYAAMYIAATIGLGSIILTRFGHRAHPSPAVGVAPAPGTPVTTGA